MTAIILNGLAMEYGSDMANGPRTLLLPKEHGTYGEVLFPLATAVLIGNGAQAALLLTLAALAGYMAHEGLAVWLGQRGARALRQELPAARRSVLLFGGVAVGAGAAGFLAGGPGLALWLGVAAVLSLLALIVAWLGVERTATGEILAAAALAAWGVPVAVAGAVAPAHALGCWAVWVVAFSASTLAVRTVIARTCRRPTRASVVGSLLICVTALLVFARVPFAGIGRGGLLWGVLPTIAAVAVLTLAQVPARRLRAIGWMLIASSAATMTALVTILR